MNDLTETHTADYNVAAPCRVCGALPGEPCRRYTDEWDEPGARKGDPTPWPHRFGGRVIPPEVTAP